MNQEQPPKIEKEKEEVSFDEIKEFLEQRKDFYSDSETGDISPLLKELEEQKYENVLEFFERILGQPIELIKRGTIQIDLISEKSYREGKFNKRDKDIKKESYKEKKKYLRKIVKKLTEEHYKDRQNFDHITGMEKEEILGHMRNSIDFKDKFAEIEEKFKKGDYSDLFDYIDFKVARTSKGIQRLRAQGDEGGVKHELEFLEKLRRTRLFFTKHV